MNTPKATTHGGARAGAGRKKNEPVLLDSSFVLTADPKEFLLAVMNDAGIEARLRVDAAKSLLPFMHKKIGETSGKKDIRQTAAEKASTGKYAPSAPPKLSVINPVRDR